MLISQLLMKFADKNHHNFMCVQLSGLEILVYDCLDEVCYIVREIEITSFLLVLLFHLNVIACVLCTSDQPNFMQCC